MSDLEKAIKSVEQLHAHAKGQEALFKSKGQVLAAIRWLHIAQGIRKSLDEMEVYHASGTG